MADISKRRHPLWSEYIDNWEFYMESYKGGDPYVSKYLYTHRLENGTDYLHRQERAYFLNYCSPISNIPSEFIFKKEATRPVDNNLEVFRLDTDRRGTCIHEFMKKVCILTCIYGHVHIIIDRQRPPIEVEEDIINGKTTKMDNFLFFPIFATIIHPQNLLDWSVDPNSRTLNWILLRETVYNDEDPFKEREIEERLKIWTRDDWIVLDLDGDELDRGHHGLGEVPIVTSYHKDIDEDMVGEGMLKDVAEANRSIFNWCSNVDEMIARQTFSQLTCPDDGTFSMEEVDEEGRSQALGKVGNASIFTYPADARHPPDFISPDTKQINVIWDMVEKHVTEMFRMAGLISAKSSLIQLQQRTGKSQEYEFLDMAVFLENKAKSLEEVENKINVLCYKWLNIKRELPSRVHYPEKFDMVAPAQLIEVFTKITMNAISGTLNKELAKRLVHQVLPHAEDIIVEKIYKEIETNEILEDSTILYGGNDNKDEDINDQVKEVKKESKPKKEKHSLEPVPNITDPNKRAKWREPQSK